MTLQTPITLADLRAKRTQILDVATHYGASNIRIFGSVARGDATATSDVDVLVNFGDSVSLYEIVGFKQALQDLLGVLVDVVEDHAGLRERFRQRILAEAVGL
jgi:predicted nucleotidyltransferase